MSLQKPPQIYHLPLQRLGTHETVVVMNGGGPPCSVRTSNYTEDEEGNRTFYVEGHPEVELRIPANAIVAVIR